MEATVVGESGERVGVSVLDNAGVEHVIEMTFDGTIEYHGQDGYPDEAARRTPTGDEHVNQARRYARYYVHEELGYGTVEPYHDPDHLGAVLLAVDATSEAAVEGTFGEFGRQLRSHHEKAVDPVVEVPVDTGDHHVTYRQNVYLSEDVGRVRADLADRVGEAIAAGTDDVDADVGPAGALERTDRSLSAVLERAADRGVTLDGVASVEAVSDVHVLYSGASTGTEQRVLRGADPFDRAPDARLELPPPSPDALRELEGLLVVHLLCQIRDCYLRAGVEPPEPYRKTGPGLWECTRTYVQGTVEQYDRYHVAGADVDGYSPTVR